MPSVWISFGDLGVVSLTIGGHVRFSVVALESLDDPVGPDGDGALSLSW